jgi:hypothetical protein
MNRRFSSGKTQLLGQGIVYPVPIPLDPAVYVGALVVGLDPADNRRKMYFSDGTEWTRSIFDTIIVEQIERFVGDLFLNGFDEEDLPDPTLVENLRRYAFNNTKGLPSFVWNDQWNSLVDEARAAEIAEDVAAAVVRVAEPDLVVTVGSGGDFPSARAAFEFLGGFIPPVTEKLFAAELLFLAGHIETEQNYLIDNSLSWVRMTSEDAEVEIDCTGWDKTTPFSTARFNRSWIMAIGSTLPVPATKFRMVGTPPAEGTSFFRLNNSTMFTFGSDAITPDARTHEYTQGFIGSTLPLFLESQSTARIDRFEISGASDTGFIISNSQVGITQSRVRGDINSFSVQNFSTLRISATDYRRIPDEDAAADLRLRDGSTVFRTSGSWGGVPTVDASQGLIYVRSQPAIHGATQFDGPITGEAVTQSATDSTEGRIPVMRTAGIFGLGATGTASSILDWDDATRAAGINATRVGTTTEGTPPPDAPTQNGMLFEMRGRGNGGFQQIWFPNFGDDRAMRYRNYTGTWAEWKTVRDTVNTVVDSNGFVKEASPIVRLFADRTEEPVQPVGAGFERLGEGECRLSGVEPLAESGWQIGVPEDGNGNRLVFVATEYDAAARTLTVTTTAPEWSNEVHAWVAGAPKDIPEGRWVDLRLKALPVAEEEEGDGG